LRNLQNSLGRLQTDDDVTGKLFTTSRTFLSFLQSSIADSLCELQFPLKFFFLSLITSSDGKSVKYKIFSRLLTKVEIFHAKNLELFSATSLNVVILKAEGKRKLKYAKRR
jgi:hypothetical protein